MYYIIRVNLNGEVKYVFDKVLLVKNIRLARKFYSLSYARRYIRTHSVCLKNECEIIMPDR